MFVYFDTLKSDHEVADTKLVELVANSNIAPNKTVMVRSPSGLHRHHLAQNFSFQVLIDNGTGRRYYREKFATIIQINYLQYPAKLFLGYIRSQGTIMYEFFLEREKIVLEKTSKAR